MTGSAAEATVLGSWNAVAVVTGISAPAAADCAAPNAAASKAEAILGGAPSQLELIQRQQQAALATPAATPPSISCPPPDLASAMPVIAQNAAPVLQTLLPPGEFLASRRLAVSRTPFDQQWNRVSRAALNRRTLRRLGLDLQSGNWSERLDAVNGWANAHVRYAEDQAQYARADYWASAAETLRRAAGDCEDIAVLKMQLLAAVGIPRDAMFLTVARDLARHADHAVLIVRDGERYWLLDNATNVLVDAATAQDYRPVFSFGERGKWLHGMTGNLAAAATPAPLPALAAAEPRAAVNAP